MRIAQLAPLRVAVPPAHYGGTERCIANLTEELVRLGHDVTLFASGDSHTSARLVKYIPKAVGFDPKIEYNAYHVAMLAEVYRQADRFDVIHSHLDYLTLPFTSLTATPTLLTIHGRIDGAEYQRAYEAYRHAYYVSISASQQAQMPDINWLGTVHHSVDVDDFRFSPHPGAYLAFVGRASPEKGLDRAIRIAIRAGVPLKIAAKIDPTEQDYFDQTIAPLLEHPLIEFLGEQDEAGKREVLGHALALLAPINWPEPFGMVFIEALACGTPVLTCPCGSVPELLEDGVTGFIRRTDDELVAAVAQVAGISRRRVRHYAQERFDIRRMAREYLNLYALVQRRTSFFSTPLRVAEPQRKRTAKKVIAFTADPPRPDQAEEANGSVLLP